MPSSTDPTGVTLTVALIFALVTPTGVGWALIAIRTYAYIRGLLGPKYRRS